MWVTVGSFEPSGQCDGSIVNQFPFKSKTICANAEPGRDQDCIFMRY